MALWARGLSPRAATLGAALLMAGAALAFGAPRIAAAQDDPRALGHGLAAVMLPDGRARLFASLPTGPVSADGGWTHDILTAIWSPGGATDWQPLVHHPDAQEPASAARMPDGRILLTYEDGWATDTGVTQRYRLYDDDLNRLAPQDDRAEIAPGAHSGHVAATRDHFVVAWSEGWIEGGGVDDLGTGHGVYATLLAGDGQPRRQIDLAPARRDWWPLVAALPDRALVVWQSLNADGTTVGLRLAGLDPGTGAVFGPVDLAGAVQPYIYDIAPVPALDLFLLTGTDAAGCGFARLIDARGQLRAAGDDLPPTRREAQALIDGHRAYVPTTGGQIVELALTATSIAPHAIHAGGPDFGTTGSLGLIGRDGALHWFALAAGSVAQARMDLTQPQPPQPCRLQP